jgi:hypothetical protein
VSNVYQNRETIKKQNASGANPQIDKLRSALVAKRDSSVKSGHIDDIKTIDKALAQLDANLKNQPQTKKVENSQNKTAQARQEIQVVSAVISEKESLAIKAMRSIPTMSLPTGRVFASISGREPSNTSYMKTNIQGLWALMNTKNS